MNFAQFQHKYSGFIELTAPISFIWLFSHANNLTWQINAKMLRSYPYPCEVTKMRKPLVGF